jgi:hypothetical protein
MNNDNQYGTAPHPPTWSLKDFQDQVLCEAVQAAGCSMDDYKPGLKALSDLLSEASARYNAYQDGIAVGVDGMHVPGAKPTAEDQAAQLQQEMEELKEARLPSVSALCSMSSHSRHQAPTSTVFSSTRTGARLSRHPI